MADNKLQLFKPNDITVEIDGKREKLVFDMNAVLEIEKQYTSIDTVFKMLFTQAAADHVVKVNGVEIDINTITVNDTPLIQHLQVQDDKYVATIKDTINLLWIGTLHDHATWDEDGEIISCDMSKATIRKGISFKKLAEINTQIVSAIIRDLIAPDNDKDTEGELKN